MPSEFPDDVENLAECEHRLPRKCSTEPTAGVQSLELCEPMVTHRPVAIRRSRQLEVMDDDQFLIARQLHVELDHVDA